MLAQPEKWTENGQNVTSDTLKQPSGTCAFGGGCFGKGVREVKPTPAETQGRTILKHAAVGCDGDLGNGLRVPPVARYHYSGMTM